jgi:hypothetical protein
MQPSTISAKIRWPSAAVAVVASPSTPTSLTAATPPRRIDGNSSDNGAPLPAQHRSVSTSVGEICISTDVSVWPACASAPSTAHPHHPMSRASARNRRTARVNAATFPPWPLTKTKRCAQQLADLPYSTSSIVRASVPIEIVPAKLWCSPLSPYAMAGATSHC